MRFLTWSVLAGTLVVTVAACYPAFNWRDVRPEGVGLSLLMPCKPDKAQKTVAMGGAPAELMLLSCDAGGVTFALAFTDVKDIAKTAPALAQWQSVTLANMKAAPNPATQAIKLTGLPTGAVLVKATGLRPNGQAVSSQAAYFVQGTQVFQAVMYADKIAPDVAETFLSGLKFE